MSQNVTITNRIGLKVAVRVDCDTDTTSKLAFVAHGLKGTMDQPHIQAFTRSFLENGYRVVRFDATNSVGQSGGTLEDVTLDSYVHDLEDVIEWAKTQDWFIQPFALCGHSMGAQSTSWYAEHHADDVSLLLAMAPVVNYELYRSTMDPAVIRSFQELGYVESVSSSDPSVVRRIGSACLDSVKRYDIIPYAHLLTMPVLNIVGSEDVPCPPAHQQLFMGAITHETKELIVIPGLEHSYRNALSNQVDAGLDEVESVVTQWLHRIEPAA